MGVWLHKGVGQERMETASDTRCIAVGQQCVNMAVPHGKFHYMLEGQHRILLVLFWYTNIAFVPVLVQRDVVKYSLSLFQWETLVFSVV